VDEQVNSTSSEKPSSQATSGVNSQVPASPTLCGHSVVAKRATSPKPPKVMLGQLSRGNSPLGSRPTSPVGDSRAASPSAAISIGRSESPKSNNKRKAVDEATNRVSTANGVASNATPKPKKRRAQGPNVPGVAMTPEQLRGMLVEWLSSTANATTRDCIHHFTPYLTDSEKKAEFSGLVREVAQLKGGVLVLRKKFQEGGSPRGVSPT